MKFRFCGRRFLQIVAAPLLLAGCADCLQYNPTNLGGGSARCSGAGQVLALAALPVTLPVLALADAAEESSRTAFAEPPLAEMRPPAPDRPYAARRCRSGAATCEVRIFCPAGAQQCRVPALDRTCPAGQTCTFTVPQP